MSSGFPSGSLLEAAFNETGRNYRKCYQCGKCTAGCPLRYEMDIPVSELVRMVQNGGEQNDEDAIRSHAIWICLSCETCSTRCPQEIYPSEMMDFLRHESYRQKKVNPAGRRIVNFHEAFLDSVKAHGRIYEVGLVANMKIKDTFSLNIKEMMRDVTSAPDMLMKGKLPLLPHPIKGTDEMKKIYDKCLGTDE